LVAATVAGKTFGPAGGTITTLLIILSICGSMGGLVLTLPRLFYGASSLYEKSIPKNHPAQLFFGWLSRVSARHVPIGSILFSAFMSCVVLLAFQSFSKLANFLVVPMQVVNILLVASIYRLRKKEGEGGYRTPGYPITPFIYLLVMSLFLASAIYFNPKETLIGIAIMLTAVPIFLWINNESIREKV
jgi:APA family basic amino acid/polyamine antiporter